MTEREKLIKLLMKCSNVPSMFAEKLADYFLSHGVTIPVRCSECKYLVVINGEHIYAHCLMTKNLFYPFEQDTRKHFCAFGERKDNG